MRNLLLNLQSSAIKYFENVEVCRNLNLKCLTKKNCAKLKKNHSQ